MPKRNRDKHSESDYDHLAKKLKKLERKIKIARRRRKPSLSTESDTQSPHNTPESKSIANNDTPGAGATSVASYDHSPAPVVVAVPEAIASPQDTAVNPDEIVSAPDLVAPEILTIQQPSEKIADTSDNISGPEAPLELDADIMIILGEDPTSTKNYGSDIQKDLAIRINHIVTSGLSKEIRKEIKDNYLVPGNCKLMKAPSLNPEIRASLIESQAKRDKGIKNRQNMNSCALSSLSKAITILLAQNNKDQELLKILMDTARILGDIQHSDSILRRFFILSTVKKELKDQLEKTNIDEMLFGSNLAETLKSAKTISKTGADIRSIPAVKPAVQTTPKTSGRPLNYRAPPATRKPTAVGATRGARQLPPPTQSPRATTTRPTQYNASRTSWRQQPPRHRR